jgi:hypothetical protein
MNPAYHCLPTIAIRPQAMTSATPVVGKSTDFRPISGQGLRLFAMLSCTAGVGAAATDNLQVACRIDHSDTVGGAYTTHRTLATVVAVTGLAGAHGVMVDWPRINLEGVKAFSRVVLTVTANAANGGATTGIVGSVNGLIGGSRDLCQDDLYQEPGYAISDKIRP